ncbi:MAG: hypothetical protein NTV58_16830 [Deltaproteobacteria bacterium]|nr:hypothetical protein [Deltaproteobacteria bacterium]
MNDFSQFGKIFLIIGLVVAGVGLLMIIGGKITTYRRNSDA